MLDMIAFPVVVLLGFLMQAYWLIGPAGLFIVCLGVWAWSRR